ncbi:MAG: succinylglutamate desuccinylase/aspartoacylase family protein [Proteobacteria bacterium]|nr:succinylglutamate desuccinylase/aspartoacylase family protein [Pseudomonadota bacterium]
MPLADVVIDLHSGGSSLIYIPSALTKIGPDRKRSAKQLELLEVFGAPIGYVVQGMGEDRTSTSAGERQGALVMGTEVGGAGMVGVESTRICEAGVQRILEHLGILKPTQLSRERPKTRIMEVGGIDYYVYAPEPGLFEPYVDLGATVKKGQPAGAVQFVDNPLRSPVMAHFAHDGMVICKRVPGRVERGDCLFHLATDRG